MLRLEPKSKGSITLLICDINASKQIKYYSLLFYTMNVLYHIFRPNKWASNGTQRGKTEHSPKGEGGPKLRVLSHFDKIRT